MGSITMTGLGDGREETPSDLAVSPDNQNGIGLSTRTPKLGKNYTLEEAGKLAKKWLSNLMLIVDVFLLAKDLGICSASMVEWTEQWTAIRPRVSLICRALGLSIAGFVRLSVGVLNLSSFQWTAVLRESRMILKVMYWIYFVGCILFRFGNAVAD